MCISDRSLKGVSNLLTVSSSATNLWRIDLAQSPLGPCSLLRKSM